MKTIKYLLFLLLIAIIAAAIYIAVQPNEYTVTRTKNIKAPTAVVYNNVIDFNTWESWSTLKEKSNDVKIKLSENTKEINSYFSWEDKDGIGTIKTINTNPNKSIQQEMQYGDFPKANVSWQFINKKDNTTDVTWQIKASKLPFKFKAYTAFMGGMENIIGPEYETGLENLNTVIQNKMKKYSITVANETTQHSGGFYIYNTATTTFSDFQAKMAKMYPEIIAYAQQNNITMAGAPYVIYHKWDEANNEVSFSCCIPTTTRVVVNNDSVFTGRLAPFKAVKTTLKGDYVNLKEAWETTMKKITSSGLEKDENGPAIEAYLNSPVNTPNPANLKTEIYIAVK